MKTSYKIITGALFLSVVLSSSLYALNGFKSVKLPWQGTKSGAYNATYNVGLSYLPDVRFTLADSNTTVTDSITGLKWQSYFNTGSADYIANYSASGTWVNAIAYCSGLTLGGTTGWRVPTIKELGSILDLSRYNPNINTSYFGTQLLYYWSSTPNAQVPTNAWTVRFGWGDTTHSAKTGMNYVRCVH